MDSQLTVMTLDLASSMHLTSQAKAGPPPHTASAANLSELQSLTLSLLLLDWIGHPVICRQIGTSKPAMEQTFPTSSLR